MKSMRESFRDQVKGQLRNVASIGDTPQTPSITEMNCGDVRLTIDAGGLLVDVRQPVDYQGTKIHLSQNIPCQFIQTEIQGRGISYNIPIMLYCNDGYTAQLAKTKLEEIGYKNVSNIGSIKNFNGCR
jgi:rhodanese-related sulfurtransferase